MTVLPAGDTNNLALFSDESVAKLVNFLWGIISTLIDESQS